MSRKLTKQWSDCFGWYSNLKGLKHHLRYCRRSNDCQTSEEVQRHMAHPMLFLSSRSSVFASNRSFQLEDENTHHADMDQTEDCDFGENRDGNDLTFDNDIESSFRSLHRKTMAVTKFQVMLNDLLLNTRRAYFYIMRWLTSSVSIHLLPILIDLTSSNPERRFYNQHRNHLAQVVLDHWMVLFGYTMTHLSQF